MKKGPDTAQEGDRALDRETYCGRLGHLVPYRYCLRPAQDSPCFKVMDCWWQQFDVESDLRTRVAPELFERLARRDAPPNRLQGILRVLDDLRRDGILK